MPRFANDQSKPLVQAGVPFAPRRGVLARVPFDHVTREIIAAAIEVHRVIGPGLLESAYATCLQHELSMRGLGLATQQRVPLIYKGLTLDCAYRLDLLVDRVVVVEVKAIETVLPIHLAQLLTYLRLTDLPVGLVINFQVDRLVKGVKRVLRTPTIERLSVRLR